jgi:hypothetical protein
MFNTISSLQGLKYIGLFQKLFFVYRNRPLIDQLVVSLNDTIAEKLHNCHLVFKSYEAYFESQLYYQILQVGLARYFHLVGMPDVIDQVIRHFR